MAETVFNPSLLSWADRKRLLEFQQNCDADRGNASASFARELIRPFVHAVFVATSSHAFAPMWSELRNRVLHVEMNSEASLHDAVVDGFVRALHGVPYHSQIREMLGRLAEEIASSDALQFVVARRQHDRPSTARQALWCYGRLEGGPQVFEMNQELADGFKKAEAQYQRLVQLRERAAHARQARTSGDLSTDLSVLVRRWADEPAGWMCKRFVDAYSAVLFRPDNTEWIAESRQRLDAYCATTDIPTRLEALHEIAIVMLRHGSQAGINLVLDDVGIANQALEAIDERRRPGFDPFQQAISEGHVLMADHPITLRRTNVESITLSSADVQELEAVLIRAASPFRPRVMREMYIALGTAFVGTPAEQDRATETLRQALGSGSATDVIACRDGLRGVLGVVQSGGVRTALERLTTSIEAMGTQRGHDGGGTEVVFA